MKLMFFYWQRDVFGAWSPVKSVDRPSKKAEGKEPDVSGVVRIGPEDYDLGLNELMVKYPRPKGETET
jgi:hypothetical protein